MIDIRIDGGLVIDTAAKTEAVANVCIDGGKVVEVSGACPNAKRVIDASGLVVAPGFIDVHAHLDGYAYGARLAAAQGITTTVVGNCGISLTPAPRDPGVCRALHHRFGRIDDARVHFVPVGKGAKFRFKIIGQRMIPVDQQ